MVNETFVLGNMSIKLLKHLFDAKSCKIVMTEEITQFNCHLPREEQKD
jgi:hypothetical protein